MTAANRQYPLEMWSAQQSISNSAETPRGHWPWLSFAVFRDGTYTLTLLDDAHHTVNSERSLKPVQLVANEIKGGAQIAITKEQSRTTEPLFTSSSKQNGKPSTSSASLFRNSLRASSASHLPLKTGPKIRKSLQPSILHPLDVQEPGRESRMALEYLKMSDDYRHKRGASPNPARPRTRQLAPVFFTLNDHVSTAKISSHHNPHLLSIERSPLSDEKFIRKRKSLNKSTSSTQFYRTQNIQFSFINSIKEKQSLGELEKFSTKGLPLSSSAAVSSTNVSTKMPIKIWTPTPAVTPSATMLPPSMMTMERSKTEQPKLNCEDSVRSYSPTFTEIQPLKSILKNSCDIRLTLSLARDDQSNSFEQKSEHDISTRNTPSLSKRGVRFDILNNSEVKE